MESGGLRNLRRMPKKKPIIENKDTTRLLKEIRSGLDKGHRINDLLWLVVAWARIQVKRRVDIEDIAGRLNELEIPTTSGAGEWHAGTIEYLLSH